ncbi:MAG: hypothetical protein WDZ93_03585 [Candidatus Paceibacterota bacterium]
MKRHEQIVIAVLGYIIGFVTAFIAFELTDQKEPMFAEKQTEQSEYGLVASANESGGIIRDVIIDNEGLFVKIGTRDRIVSASTMAPEEDFNGYHYAVSETALAEDQRLLYYCVQVHVDDGQCYSYIYNADTDTVHPVRDAETGEYVQMEIGSLDAAWKGDRTLAVNHLVSVSNETPWMVE